MVLNLDGTVARQPRLLSFPHHWLDFSGTPGTWCCASPEALAALEAALARHREVPLVFWGAGEYHYVTYARLRTLRVPLTLVLFDRHHDCDPGGDGLVTCGNWVRHALALPWVQRVLWIGGPDREGPAHPRLWRVPHRRPPEPLGRWLDQAVPTPFVYLSVDKDVLHPADAVTTWGSGELRLQDLLAWVTGLLRARRVVGADVGGEWVLPPGRVLPTPADLRAIGTNEAANLALLEVLENLPGFQHQAARQTGA
nr:MAG: arginase [Bacillota bacterium]